MPLTQPKPYRPGIFIRFVAWVNNGRGVWLRDRDGEIGCSIAYESPFGDWVAKRWWPYSVRVVRLKDGGGIEPDCYVKEWVEWK